jgi:hypothetical protein
MSMPDRRLAVRRVFRPDEPVAVEIRKLPTATLPEEPGKDDATKRNEPADKRPRLYDAVAPESRLLGADNHKQNYRPWDKRHRAHLTLSISPKQTNGFNVALTTANESLLMRIARDLD